MDLNKLFKAMLVAVPLMALGACSSTSDSETDASGSMSGTGSEYGTGGIETGGAGAVLSPVEQQRLKEQELRRQNIIYFDFDRSEVQSENAEILQAHGNYLVENPNVRVLIEGHADERGTPEYNIALGERRAKAIAKYLQGMGVQPSQMSIVSYGEEKPLDYSRTDTGFGLNRRGVLVY
ncbi:MULTISPECIES: peptidoglycan-associated lipoprotein Pal [Shewanella]|uniref:Peptidoglycan-associated lipoprotein n=3 Tax=Shewanella TaxID=22 RepID=A0A9X2CBX1_9GAMM|nr:MULTISPECIES: peptidoglycan-associated lipoprotein Pal [Shewanella]MCL1103546.1 peptidoglycan-associated lipoprotein Pal [Shewanella saliphila]MCL1105383.1 peptidoglycan-associated lipoprotein Pal [Shewanella algicola]MCT8986084.1 peptidoglycan-associated lipoprotein Pal [Shewanella sp. KJ10-1]GGP50418.1 peptidoglycan-associated lipoprotein [Shewanella algicola]GGP70504.1 peptidoglycan-associated lipoprotein [Shewanella saliphila]